MRHLARSCTNFILFSVHSSFYLFRWMMSAVFREEPSLRVGPLLAFFLFWFGFSFFGLECKPFVFLGWWSCHFKIIYYNIRSDFYFEVA